MVRSQAGSNVPRLGYNGQTCLECGAPMRETLRWQQGEMLFTWFECSRPNCSAKFLRKASLGVIPALKPLRPVTDAAMHA